MTRFSVIYRCFLDVLLLICCNTAYVVGFEGNCPKHPENYGETKTISNIEYFYNVSRTSEDKIEVSLVITWDVIGNHGSESDGILFNTGSALSSEKAEIYTRNTQALTKEEEQICKDLLFYNRTNLTDDKLNILCRHNGNRYECLNCTTNNLCNAINNYAYLDKETRLLQWNNVQFGQKHDIVLRTYVNYTLSEKTRMDLYGFCMHELVERQNMNELEASKLCKHLEFDSGGDYCSGPVSSLVMKPKYDLANNSAPIEVSWNLPLDIAKNSKVTSFRIKLNGQEGIEKFFVTETLRNQKQFTWKTDLEINAKYYVEIIPLCGKKKGYSISDKIVLKDIDACSPPDIPSYCDVNARCIDFESTSKVAARCQCDQLYAGNGVNTYWNGSGCRLDCGKIKNHLCSKTAVCSNSTLECTCPRLSFGDGLLKGSGCTGNEIFILPTIAFLIIVIVICFGARRWKQRNEMRKRSSIFVVAYENDEGAKLGTVKNISTVFEKWEVDRKDLFLGDVLGRGKFAVVNKGILITSKDGVMKHIDVAVKTPSDGRPDDEFLSEMHLLMSTEKHKNIVSVIACCTADSPILLITEYLMYGDLRNFLLEAREDKNWKRDDTYLLTDSDICRICKQIADGMQHLAHNRIIHGDLAARNVLVGKDLVCKISDFGLANDVYRYGEIRNAMERNVPFKWTSPERMERGKVPITWRSDVWSFGIVMYEAITLGSSPFPNITSTDDLYLRLKTGYRMGRPMSCSKEFYEIMKSCWQWIPSNRPSFKTLSDMLKRNQNIPGTYVNIQCE
ncbi:uncharacterized protein LOC120343370 [Styela clava]